MTSGQIDANFLHKAPTSEVKIAPLWSLLMPLSLPPSLSCRGPYDSPPRRLRVLEDLVEGEESLGREKEGRTVGAINSVYRYHAALGVLYVHFYYIILPPFGVKRG